MARGKGTYYNNTSLPVQRVIVPDRIKCTRCHKIKIRSAFSANQQNELKAKILEDARFNPLLSEWVSCLECTPSGQRFEFKCNDCDIVKGRARFYKTQLRNPDSAICIDCSNTRRDTEPGGDSRDGSGSDGSGNSDDSSYGGGDSDDEGASTMAGTMSGISLGGTGKGTSSYQTSATGGVKLAGSTWIASYTSAASRVVSSAVPSTTTGGSVTASQASGTWPAQFKKTTPASGWATQGPSYAAGASRRGAPLGPGEQSSGNGKFAKVRATQGKQTVEQTPGYDSGDDITVAASSDEDSE
ncbi:hypothetical protein LTR35_008169 [Friedmanniomyces endolithicus]|nr:hypothetical protein LTR35_008169 [Friedmanniomyces endolithicus]KAK0296190.1 hypothetical protein LTS00_005022 [Friedmanniomyces endolithicus]